MLLISGFSVLFDDLLERFRLDFDGFAPQSSSDDDDASVYSTSDSYELALDIALLLLLLLLFDNY